MGYSFWSDHGQFMQSNGKSWCLENSDEEPQYIAAIGSKVQPGYERVESEREAQHGPKTPAEASSSCRKVRIVAVFAAGMCHTAWTRARIPNVRGRHVYQQSLSAALPFQAISASDIARSKLRCNMKRTNALATPVSR